MPRSNRDRPAPSRLEAARARMNEVRLEPRARKNAVAEALRDLLAAEVVVVCTVDRAARRAVFVEVAGAPSAGLARKIDPWLARSDAVERPSAVGAMLARFVPRLGGAGPDRRITKALSSAAAVGWLGISRAGAPGHRALLRAILPDVRRRLEVEHAIRERTRAATALGAALEAIGRPAWLLDSAGHVVRANAAGTRRLDAEGDDVRAVLRATALGARASAEIEVAPLLRGTSSGFLAIERAGALPRVTPAGALELTPRERCTLELVRAGLSNREIAARLGVATRTAELRVTGLFQKAQVESRAALLARLLSEDA